MSEVWEALLDAGVEVTPLDARHLELRRGRRRARLLLKAFSRGVSPSEVGAIVDRYPEPGLVVVPAATARVRQALETAGWSWLVTGGDGIRGTLRLGGGDVHVGEPPSQKARPGHQRPGRVPWGSLTVVRRLVAQPALTQKALAASANVSQPRVSQILAALAKQRLVERTNAGWSVRDFDRLVHRWLESYPGPGGIGTFWYGLGAPTDQASAAMSLLSRRATSRRRPIRDRLDTSAEPFAVLSGDVAADLVAPWRSPSRSVIYARGGADLSDAGLTPADAKDATLELIVPEDPGLWPASDGQPSIPIADMLQILWDVKRSPGPDSLEAFQRLWEVIRTRGNAVRAKDAA
jgi:hypothetical protein